MGRQPKTPTEAALAAMKRDAKLQRIEAKLAKGWLPPPPKEAKPRPPDVLEEITPNGVQLTIFAAIAASCGSIRAKELQQLHAGNAQTTGRGPEQPEKKGKAQEAKAPAGASSEEEAIQAWLTSALG